MEAGYVKKKKVVKKCEICKISFKTFFKKARCCSKKCTDKRYSSLHKEEKKAYDVAYRTDNLEKQNRYAAEYKQKNKHLRWKKEKKRLKKNPQLAMYKNILTVIKCNMKKGKAASWNKTFKMLNFSFDDLVKRLKRTMPVGYSWEDYLNGALHLDHIKPHCLFKYSTSDDSEFKECWALNNLRLLPKNVNIKWIKNHESLSRTYKKN